MGLTNILQKRINRDDKGRKERETARGCDNLGQDRRPGGQCPDRQAPANKLGNPLSYLWNFIRMLT